MTHGDQRLRISIRDYCESATVNLAGDVDVASVVTLRRCLSQCMDEGRRDLTVEMGEVTFMDSSGIAALLAARRQLEEAGGRLTLSNPSWTVRKVLDVSGLISEFVIDGGEDAAPLPTSRA